MQEEDLLKIAQVLQANQDQNLVERRRSFVTFVNGRVTPLTNVLSYKPKTKPKTRQWGCKICFRASKKPHLS